MKFSKQIEHEVRISSFLNLFNESLDIRELSSIYILVLINHIRNKQYNERQLPIKIFITLNEYSFSFILFGT